MGVLAQSDNKGAMLISVCTQAGLKVPDQVAVVGVDDDELACEFAPVRLSSVESNREELAYAGAALLGRAMRGLAPQDVPARIAPSAVVVRESSDILAIRHAQVAAALRFIWQHYAEPITVDHVLRARTMSWCGLYRAFEKHLGRTIGDEIARRRIEHAKRLLARTDERIHSVATLSGFSSGEHMARVFARLTGQTPREYRRVHAC